MPKGAPETLKFHGPRLPMMENQGEGRSLVILEISLARRLSAFAERLSQTSRGSCFKTFATCRRAAR